MASGKRSERRGDNGERRFLQGPQPRGIELLRAVQIFLEFVNGFRKLHFVGPCVTVFGSARFDEEHRYYQLGRETGRLLAEAGFTVMTGGGPGIMEAAARGAKDVGGRTVGCRIDLPEEQGTNDYLDVTVDFHRFYVRKVMLLKYSYAFIVLPGGFGTFDEVFETATLVQTAKIADFPIILLGSDFWSPLVDLLRTKLIPAGTIDETDLALLRLTDSPEEAVAHIRSIATEKFGLTYGPKARKRWLFWE